MILLRKNEDIIATNRRVSQANLRQLAVVEDGLHVQQTNWNGLQIAEDQQ